jgi:hypothetical protein
VLLGIPDVPPQQQDASRDALGGSGGAPKPEEATIDEVEEELEVEEEK